MPLPYARKSPLMPKSNIFQIFAIGDHIIEDHYQSIKILPELKIIVPFEEHVPSPTCPVTFYRCELHHYLDKVQPLQKQKKKCKYSINIHKK